MNIVDTAHEYVGEHKMDSVKLTVINILYILYYTRLCDVYSIEPISVVNSII